MFGCSDPEATPASHLSLAEDAATSHRETDAAPDLDVAADDGNTECAFYSSLGCVRYTEEDQDGDLSPGTEDCDDHDYYRSPWRNDQPCNGVDEDCDGEDLCMPIDRDSDGDPDTTDCAPDDPEIGHDGWEIVCDGIDQTCDGHDPCDRDGDHDTDEVDCDDSDPSRHAGAVETFCDGIDNDCDGADCCDQDSDDDGFVCREDCNDAEPGIHPGAERSTVCDYEDRDCDGRVDFDGCS